MRKFDFVICYDISCPKRLSHIAKYLESNGIRIQKSIFLYSQISKEVLSQIVDKIILIIDNDSDDVRVYQIDISRSISINSAIDLSNPLIVK